MAGGASVKIKGGISTANEAEVVNGRLRVTLDAAELAALGGGAIEHAFFLSDADLAVASLDIMDADPIGPSLPILRAVTAEDVGVSFLHDAAPEGGTWTLRIQKRLAGTDVFTEEATFVFAK
jgi:hypothetical protein